MGFAVSAEAYDRFMGRFSAPLADAFSDWAGVSVGMQVLDVGSGPGALATVLVDRVGSGGVAAVDPMPGFVAALRERLPGVTAEVAPAEALPFADDTFDAALANLVVSFMADPHAGVVEMARVTRPGGTIAATVWQHADGIGPLTPFWQGVRDVLPEATGENTMIGTARGQLAALFTDCGLADVREGALEVSLEFTDFASWWEPFTHGVGPAGAFWAAQPEERQQQIRAACAERLGPAPFTVVGQAWCALGTA
jgi:SAM-dependent methyltransferase